MIPAINITAQDAGDVSWQTVTLTDDTVFIVDFPDPDLPKELIVEIINGGNYSVTWGDSNSLPLLWEGGTEPTLTSNGKDVIRFLYDGESEVFGKVIGSDFGV